MHSDFTIDECLSHHPIYFRFYISEGFAILCTRSIIYRENIIPEFSESISHSSTDSRIIDHEIVEFFFVSEVIEHGDCFPCCLHRIFALIVTDILVHLPIIHRDKNGRISSETSHVYTYHISSRSSYPFFLCPFLFECLLYP